MSSDLFLRPIKEISAALDREEQLELWKKAINGDQEATAQIVLSMRGLIISEARKLGVRSYEMEDVVQAATLTILEHLFMYDPTKRVKLSTYLAYWIRNSIQQWLRKNGGSTTLPQEARMAIAILGLRPTHESLEKLAAHLHRDPQHLLNAIKSAGPSISLEGPIISDEPDTKSLEEVLVTEQTNSPESTVLKEKAQEIIKQAIEEVLTERERQAIILRFGLNGNEPHTYKQISQALSICPERARQIVYNATQKIKDYLYQNPRKISFLQMAFK